MIVPYIPNKYTISILLGDYMAKGHFEKGISRKYKKNCIQCNQEYIGYANINYCSKKCFLLLKKVTGDKGCWLWKGNLSSKGYGKTSYSKSLHRLSWEVFKGEIPKGKYVCHHCDVKKCYNPDHLFIGTAKENMKDAINKGIVNFEKMKENRRSKHAILTIDDVIKIKKMLVDKIPFRKIAILFNISRGSIEAIKYNKTWKDVNILK